MFRVRFFCLEGILRVPIPSLWKNIFFKCLKVFFFRRFRCRIEIFERYQDLQNSDYFSRIKFGHLAERDQEQSSRDFRTVEKISWKALENRRSTRRIFAKLCFANSKRKEKRERIIHRRTFIDCQDKYGNARNITNKLQARRGLNVKINVTINVMFSSCRYEADTVTARGEDAERWLAIRVVS